MTTTDVRPDIAMSDVVAGNVRAEAARLGMSQLDLAKALGMAQTTVSFRWRGIRPWQIDDLATLARALGVEIADLLQPTGRECPRQDSNLQPSDYTFAALGCTWAVAA